MTVDVLQSFLNARLFDVSGDDARVARMREAASDLGAVLKASPERTVAFTMVEIDRDVGPDEPIVRETVAVLEKRWQSYAGAFSDQQLPTVARAIILQALANTIESDGIAAAVAATSHNLLPYIGSRTDGGIWVELVASAEMRLNQLAQREWGLPASMSETLVFELPKIEPVEIPVSNRKWLAERISAAAGPTDDQNNAIKDANTVWTNSAPTWSHAFAPIAASGITATIDDVVKRLAQKVEPSVVVTAIGSALAEFATGVAEASAGTLRVIERRSRLLWWKESLFSPSARVSYRSLDPAIAAALAATDANAQTGPFAPRMVEHFLGETLRSIDPEAMALPRYLAELAASVQADASPSGDTCRSAFGSVKGSAGRTPLTSLMASDEKVDEKVIAARLGLEGDVRMSPIDFALWLFRELQASAANPPPPKRKTASRR